MESQKLIGIGSAAKKTLAGTQANRFFFRDNKLKRDDGRRLYKTGDFIRE
jgi:hypothetical protein